MKKDFCYCNGKGCAIREHCVRYVDGCKARKDDTQHTWMDECGEDRVAYISDTMPCDTTVNFCRDCETGCAHGRTD